MKEERAESIRNLPVIILQRSPFQPRKSLRNIGELWNSIKAKGVSEPLLVRPLQKVETLQDQFELVDGHRRHAAAVMGNLDAVPCIIREMTDEEVKETQLIRALQREGLNPYDEAVHMSEMIKTTDDYQAVAAAIGKPEAYVRRRSRLAELIEPIAKHLQDGKMSVDAALMVARLSVLDQHEVLKASKQHGNEFHTDWLKWWVSERYHELSRAPWKLDDIQLYPEAGGCDVCPKQTGSEPMLFEDVKKATCTDQKCWTEKLKRYVALQKEKIPDLVEINDSYTTAAKGTEGQSILNMMNYRELPKGADKCEATKTGMIVVGQAGLGQKKMICTDPECKVHRGVEVSRGSAQMKDPDARKKELREQKIQKLMTAKAYRAASDETPKLNDLAFLRIVAEAFWDRLWHESKRSVLGMEELEPGLTQRGKDYDKPMLAHIANMQTQLELKKILLKMAVAPILTPNYNISGWDLLRPLKIDLKAIRKEVEAEMTKPKKTEKKKLAEKKAKKKK